MSEHTAENDPYAEIDAAYPRHNLVAHAYGGGFGIRVTGCEPCEESGEEPGTEFRVIPPGKGDPDE
jgi:hypothetical protein